MADKVEKQHVDEHEEDCPCWGDVVPHSKDCRNCTCEEKAIEHPAFPHTERIDEWMTANELSAPDVRWASYPIGMVQRWIERAEAAEAQLAAALRDKERLDWLLMLIHQGGNKLTVANGTILDRVALDAAMSSSQPPAPTCARCDGPLLFRRDCHICNVPLCDHTCEEWHLEKVHGQS